MRFEWDANKDRSNRIKYGISFTLAERAWSDPHLMTILDITSLDEERWLGIGRIGIETILVVVHTFRGSTEEEVIRIISARRATRGEKALYEKNLF